ncbi:MULTISPECIES: crotonase/enoyl-CoA hydratase family protein [Xanthomonas]|uniref:Enoyl-CoA hydratase n=2 Tax=Xanthomonas TaxID=338 RepID=A0A2S7D9Z9_9XANT|nr:MULTISPECIES: crotonase/enoyl-CoA hydratase family protein [Xanthomonas]MBE0314192.1 crotonase/enoyl-CoA hydratase family protein [Xanthomonas citri pv. punicae]MCC4589283.1 crotonase/enoyl-CoA hydratase family protein [Xanthomonas sp. NCPPB 1067]MCC4599698.1 crotonase/enoyl-CoA hydratase family protein [Xanthomonas melonis]MCD0244975.1 crotonase/enoyl-CoA hydratase family protein [Xanthomonas melonis]MCD0257412.1 crotonase/enoyl-CoA hydratase family protein [Xanthomonas melonis]
MNTIEKLQQHTSHSTIRTHTSHADTGHWLFMHADASTGVRPCFRPSLMRDMHAHLDALSEQSGEAPSGLRSLVLASDANAFNLGGDLDLFGQMIRSRDRQGLLRYAQSCVSGVFQFHQGMGGDFRTIALLQGDALGGGLEMALSCHTIVAEEGVGMGLPEVLFGLFPGMGAYSFLSRRVTPQMAERIILEGHVYSSEEMHAMGVVDILVPRGQGIQATHELITRQQRAPQSYLAMNRARQLCNPVTLKELLAVTEVWVEAALQLGEKSLRTMDRLVKAQTRRAAKGIA